MNGEKTLHRSPIRAWACGGLAGLLLAGGLLAAPSGRADSGLGPKQGPVKFHTSFGTQKVRLRSSLNATVKSVADPADYTATVFVTVSRAGSDPVRPFALHGHATTKGQRLAIPLSAAMRSRIAAAVRKTGYGAVLHVHIKGRLRGRAGYGFDQVRLAIS
jgi:hypothetical protein